MKTVAFHTLGCKVNTYESNAMLKIFQDAGYQEVDFKEVADVYVINTCTVTNTGDSKSRQMIRKAIRKNPEAVVCAVGCYSQVAPEDIEQIEGIGVVLGTQYRKEIVDLVEEYQKTNQKIVKVDSVKNLRKFEDLNIDRFKNTRAFLKIQDGCTNFCTYCIIPYARGKVRSKKRKNILEEVKSLVAKGHKEIVLTGIHISSYGKEKDDGYRLIDLLEDINKIDNLKRIRLGSLEPTLITDEFCTRLKKVTKMCHHFHLSLQSGCDKTLKEMNRKYTCEEFLEVTKRLRKLYDDVILTTDIIVGFPNETDEDFEKTYEFLKEINFYKMHIFKYSPRKGTVAYKMKNQISGAIKDVRSHKLIKLSNENEERYLKSYIGKNVNVLFEEKDGEYIKGHTQNYIMCKAKLDESKINDIVTVKAIEEKGDCLICI